MSAPKAGAAATGASAAAPAPAAVTRSATSAGTMIDPAVPPPAPRPMRILLVGYQTFDGCPPCLFAITCFTALPCIAPA